MKKKFVAFMMIGALALSAVACGSVSSEEVSDQSAGVSTIEDEESPTAVGIANPWRDSTEEECYQYGPNGFSAPEGATNVKWSINEVADNTVLPGTMIQMAFDLDDGRINLIAREQPVAGEEIVDISGMYYDWTVEDEGTLANWAGGNMAFKSYRYIGDDQYVDVINWFDIETGYAYSLSAVAKDLDGFDIQAIAEQIYDPAKQIGANMPDDTESGTDLPENSNEFIKGVAEDCAPAIDITGCDTFTQIVDKKLSDGMGYANEQILDTDVFLVSSGTFEDPDTGKAWAIDATIFEYKDGAPVEIGKVCSGGTAYPLTLKDGYLYSASNHWICKYAIADDQIMIMEKASVVYNTEGNGTYYYESDDGGDYSNFDSAEAEKIFDQLFDEMMNGDIVEFSVVSK